MARDLDASGIGIPEAGRYRLLLMPMHQKIVVGQEPRAPATIHLSGARPSPKSSRPLVWVQAT